MKTVPTPLEQLFLPPDPPPDIATDPARLGVWKQTVHDDVDFYRGLTAIDVTGCGHHVTYLCWDERDSNDGIDTFCEEVDLTDPYTRFARFELSAKAMRSLRERLASAR